MNMDHLKAILDANGPTVVVDVGGGTIVASEGHIAAAIDYPLIDDPKKQKDRDRLIGMWKSWRDSDWPEILPEDAVYSNDNKFIRKIGTARINEAFYRVFAAEGITWHWDDNLSNPVIAKQDGKLVGAVMTMRDGEGDERVESPTDAEVFANFATPQNGYYLQGDKILLKEINELRRELRTIQDRIEELHGEHDGVTDELRAKEGTLERRRKAVVA
jgi:hypothetical protein